jgi:hypothetical protein
MVEVTAATGCPVNTRWVRIAILGVICVIQINAGRNKTIEVLIKNFFKHMTSFLYRFPSYGYSDFNIISEK